MCNGGADVSGNELSGRVVLLSILCRLSSGHAAGKLAEAGMLQFPVCIFQPVVFHPAIHQDGISVFVSQGHCKKIRTVIFHKNIPLYCRA